MKLIKILSVCFEGKNEAQAHFSTYAHFPQACKFSAIGLFTGSTDRLFC